MEHKKELIRYLPRRVPPNSEVIVSIEVEGDGGDFSAEVTESIPFHWKHISGGVMEKNLLKFSLTGRKFFYVLRAPETTGKYKFKGTYKLSDSCATETILGNEISTVSILNNH